MSRVVAINVKAPDNLVRWKAQLGDDRTLKNAWRLILTKPPARISTDAKNLVVVISVRRVLVGKPLPQFGFYRAHTRVIGQVFPFIRIQMMIVQLFASVRVANVSVTL